MSRTSQHRKAIGNARTVAREQMTPVLRDVTGQDAYGHTETAYGPERAPPATTLTVNPSTGVGILAMGRLERLSAEAKEGDARLSNKEAYRLLWLPWSWAWGRNDYASNPQRIRDEVNPSAPAGVDYIVPGSRVWIVMDTDGPLTNGLKAHEFIVVDSLRLAGDDHVEYEATVERSEGVPPRTVVLQ